MAKDRDYTDELLRQITDTIEGHDELDDDDIKGRSPNNDDFDGTQPSYKKQKQKDKIDQPANFTDIGRYEDNTGNRTGQSVDGLKAGTTKGPRTVHDVANDIGKDEGKLTNSEIRELLSADKRLTAKQLTSNKQMVKYMYSKERDDFDQINLKATFTSLVYQKGTASLTFRIPFEYMEQASRLYICNEMEMDLEIKKA